MHLGEVKGVDAAKKQVILDTEDRRDVPLQYDYLILATGAQHSYFGQDGFERYAPGLKQLSDAVTVRNKILGRIEMSETEEAPERRRDLLTFIVVGGGPTGVEMASAIAVLIRSTLKKEFRRIDPGSACVILEGSWRQGACLLRPTAFCGRAAPSQQFGH